MAAPILLQLDHPGNEEAAVFKKYWDETQWGQGYFVSNYGESPIAITRASIQEALDRMKNIPPVQPECVYMSQEQYDLLVKECNMVSVPIFSPRSPRTMIYSSQYLDSAWRVQTLGGV